MTRLFVLAALWLHLVFISCNDLCSGEWISTRLLLVTGFLRDRLGSYDVAFYLAGIPPIIGGALLCLIPWVEAKRKRRETAAAQKQDPELSTKMLEKHQEDSQLQTGESVL